MLFIILPIILMNYIGHHISHCVAYYINYPTLDELLAGLRSLLTTCASTYYIMFT
jgi:fructose-specific phosphotransferase system IIC component